MKKLFSLLVFLGAVQTAWCQNQAANWCFRDSCGIHFTAASATPFVSAMTWDSTLNTQYDGGYSCAAISDQQGNLLFYTNGFTCWNRNHQKMPTYLESACDTDNVKALIIPQPEHPDHYLVFHKNTCATIDFCYSVIDMTLDSGLGDVAPGGMHHSLDSDIYENLTLAAVKHANGRDWWVIFHKCNMAQFYIYLVTPDTVVLSSQQNIGTIDFSVGAVGEISFSPDGSRMSTTSSSGGINLFDFDRCTGQLSHTVDLSDPGLLVGWPQFIDNSFSSDGSKLYVCSQTHLYQFDLNAADIGQSRQTIWSNPYYRDTLIMVSFLFAERT